MQRASVSGAPPGHHSWWQSHLDSAVFGDVVGPEGFQACLREIEAGASECSVKLSECVTLFYAPETQTSIMLTPRRCAPSDFTYLTPEDAYGNGSSTPLSVSPAPVGTDGS